MRQWFEEIPGDTGGALWRLAVLRFSSRGGSQGPSVYLQAALHATEHPGVGALHRLCEHLRRAEAEGRLLGDVTVVPVANPIGLGQRLFGQAVGRFETGSRINFNREFPILHRPDASLLATDQPRGATETLKARLLALAVPCDIVLDLHCDDEGVPYIYVHSALWPGASDLAGALGCKAAVLWDGPDGGSAFEEAALAPWLACPADEARLSGRVVATVELRGLADVSAEWSEADAAGLLRFLIGRGVVAGEAGPEPAAFEGIAASIRQVEMVRAPVAGPIWFHASPGDKVEAGDPVATILHRPGEENGAVLVSAPRAGYVLTRRAHRYTRPGEDLIKLITDRTSPGYRPGTLES